MISFTEENYLKAIYMLHEKDGSVASTNSIAEMVKTKAASVTDMLKKLSDKQLVVYEKYKGATLTSLGRKLATQLVRKHRLWEYFLVEKMGFDWDEVHDIAEELEHIQSDELINRLDNYLGNPKFDPHGDPIPSSSGKFTLRNQIPLTEFDPDKRGELIAVRDHSTEFLKYLKALNINIGSHIEILDYMEYDHSLQIKIDRKYIHVISSETAEKLLMRDYE